MSCMPRSTLKPSPSWQPSWASARFRPSWRFVIGVLVYSQAGAMPPVVLENLITQVKSLDMKEVRAKIAARKAAAAR